MASVVREYHDCPSLEHLDDLSADIFDSPRIQVRSSCYDIIEYVTLEL